MLLIEINRQQFVIDEAALYYIQNAKKVKEERVKGRCVYIVQEEPVLSGNIVIIDNKDIIYDKESSEYTIDKVKLLEEENAKYQRWWNEDHKKLKEAQAKLKAYEELCPHMKEGE